MSSSSSSSSDGTERLSEKTVQDSFHSYLKSSLTQAKAERLLDAQILSSAEGDLMITGPALCMYFAALRCTTNPPSVPLPKTSKTSAPFDLTESNCPPAFLSFLHLWSSTVAPIQALAPEAQHDLARIICGLDALSTPLNPNLNRIGAELRAVAIEISMRRSFQERYGDDLQAAIDAGSSGNASGLRVRASFVPPPVYDSSPMLSPSHSPRPSMEGLPPSPSSSPISSHHPPRSPQSPKLLSPSPSSSSFAGRRTPSPTFFPPDSPAIELIRETLYASIADALDRQPSLRQLLKTDPPRAYFASVAFAILDVSTTSMTNEGGVVGVLGQELTLDQCPPPLRPFMMELGAIGRMAKEMEEVDDMSAMKHASRGEDIPLPRMERVRRMLKEGVGYAQGRRDEQSGRRSTEGRAVAFTNRINALSLGLTKLKAFKERQRDVFSVLAGIGA